MRTYKKFLPFLYLFLVSLIPDLLIFFLVSPDEKIKVFDISIGAAVFMFFLLFLTFYFLASFLFLNTRRGFLAACFIVGVLILRALGFKSGYQIIILLAIILLIEYLYLKTPRSIRKPSRHEKS